MAPLPKVETPAEATDLVIIRKKSMLGAANTFELTLDNRKIYGIRNGQYVRLSVDSGPHTLGVRCFGGWTFWWHHYKISHWLRPKTTEYLLADHMRRLPHPVGMKPGRRGSLRGGTHAGRSATLSAGARGWRVEVGAACGAPKPV
jgi:hypothetical protein